jgi:hypothetical protein
MAIIMKLVKQIVDADDPKVKAEEIKTDLASPAPKLSTPIACDDFIDDKGVWLQRSYGDESLSSECAEWVCNENKKWIPFQKYLKINPINQTAEATNEN